MRTNKRMKRLVNNIADQRILYGGVGEHSSFKADWERVVYVKEKAHVDFDQITLKLNKIIEQMLLKNPHQWIWTHNRWK